MEDKNHLKVHEPISFEEHQKMVADYIEFLDRSFSNEYEVYGDEIEGNTFFDDVYLNKRLNYEQASANAESFSMYKTFLSENPMEERRIYADELEGRVYSDDVYSVHREAYEELVDTFNSEVEEASEKFLGIKEEFDKYKADKEKEFEWYKTRKEGEIDFLNSQLETLRKSSGLVNRIFSRKKDFVKVMDHTQLSSFLDKANEVGLKIKSVSPYVVMNIIPDMSGGSMEPSDFHMKGGSSSETNVMIHYRAKNEVEF
jgi:hypothetical protein